MKKIIKILCIALLWMQIQTATITTVQAAPSTRSELTQEQIDALETYTNEELVYLFGQYRTQVEQLHKYAEFFAETEPTESEQILLVSEEYIDFMGLIIEELERRGITTQAELDALTEAQNNQDNQENNQNQDNNNQNGNQNNQNNQNQNSGDNNSGDNNSGDNNSNGDNNSGNNSRNDSSGGISARDILAGLGAVALGDALTGGNLFPAIGNLFGQGGQYGQGGLLDGLINAGVTPGNIAAGNQAAGFGGNFGPGGVQSKLWGPGPRGGSQIAGQYLTKGGLSVNTDLKATILGWVRLLLSIAAVIAVGALIWAAFLMVTAFGDEGRRDLAKKIVIYVIAGILLIAGAYAIVNLFIEARF